MSWGARNVSDTVGRSGIVGPSILWGTVFGAVIAFGILYCIVASSGARVQNGDFGLLLGLGSVPMVGIGGTVGAVVFGVVGVIVRFGPLRLAASPLSYAVLGSLVWGAACWVRALDVPRGGATGGYLLMHIALLAGGAEAAHWLMLYGLPLVAIAGLLTGSLVKSGRNQAYRTSRPGANP
jgi:hypothetical protein